MNLSFYIAFLSLLVSGIALSWNIYRDCINRPKIKVKASVVMSIPLKNMTPIDVISKIREINPNANINPVAADDIADKINTPTEVIYVEVTNIGKKSIIIDKHEFQLDNDTDIVFPSLMEKFHNKKLDPNECLRVELPNEVLMELSKIAKNIKSFCIYDTHDKTWKLPRKYLRKLKDNLTKQRS